MPRTSEIIATKKAQRAGCAACAGLPSRAFAFLDGMRDLHGASVVQFANLTTPTIPVEGTSAHIHLGDPSVAMGPIIRHFADAPLGVTSGSFTDIWTGLTTSDIANLESGNTYINIHTEAFPDGEIRGQITSIIPEPSSLVMGSTAALVGLGLAWRRGRKLA